MEAGPALPIFTPHRGHGHALQSQRVSLPAPSKGHCNSSDRYFGHVCSDHSTFYRRYLPTAVRSTWIHRTSCRFSSPERPLLYSNDQVNVSAFSHPVIEATEIAVAQTVGKPRPTVGSNWHCSSSDSHFCTFYSYHFTFLQISLLQ